MKKLWRPLITTAVAVAIPFSALAQDSSVTPLSLNDNVTIAIIISAIANWAGGIAAGVAVLYLIYGGFQYIVGGEKGATAGKTILVNAIIGLFIIALAYAIINIVIGFLNMI